MKKKYNEVYFADTEKFHDQNARTHLQASLKEKLFKKKKISDCTLY